MRNLPVRILATILLFLPSVARSAERIMSKDGRHLFILSGQSNMREPLPGSFKKSVSQVFGEDKIIVVTVAQPSQPISRWYKNWAPPEGKPPVDGKNFGTLYDSLMTNVNRAIEGKELASVTYIWMQGEADAQAGWGAVYEKSFLGVLDQIKADLGLKSINFVIGRINDYWSPANGMVDGDVIRAIQVKLGESSPNAAWVNTDDLNTGVNPWGLYETEGGHFPNAAYRVLGQHFASKACKIIDPNAKLNPADFNAVFMDSATQIQSHLAIGKILTGTASDEAQSAGGLAALLDGKIGTVDHHDKAWLSFGPTKEGVTLDLDLGKEESVSAIVLNLLISKEAKAGYPEKIIVETSADGSQYHPIDKKGLSFFYKRPQREKSYNESPPRALLLVLEPKETAARHIRIRIDNSTYPLFMDEIFINPVAK